MFGEDLLKHLLESNMFNEEKLCSDTLLKQLCDGHFIEVLMPCSILSKSALTIEEVIKGRLMLNSLTHQYHTIKEFEDILL